MNRGYSAASSSGTQQYWYMDSLQASQVWGDIESYGVTATGSGWHSAWGTWSDSGMNMETTQAGGQGFSTSCSVNGSNFVMSVYISDNAISTYDSSFMLSGSIVYQ